MSIKNTLLFAFCLAITSLSAQTDTAQISKEIDAILSGKPTQTVKLYKSKPYKPLRKYHLLWGQRVY